jgi:cob(I)alamin adenosyltransferase
MKIYTRTGDSGDTGLFGGGRVPKDDVRVDAYGEVDELNSVMGVAVAALEAAADVQLADRLRLVQAELFTIGAHLATPAADGGGDPGPQIPPLDEGAPERMERWIDEAETEVQPLRSFVLPGGTAAAAQLHLARTVCRRAERRVVTLARGAGIDHRIVVYLNRLSDLLFTLARLANHRAGLADVPWNPNRRGA